MHSISKIAARSSRLCQLPRGLVVVRHASQPTFVDQADDFIATSSQAGERVPTQAERDKIERERQKAHRAAERERLMGEKKVEVVVERKVDKQLFEKIMMNLVEKHLEQKIVERERIEEPDIQRVPVKFTDDEQQFLNAIEPAGAESLTPEKGENDDDFWERKALANLPRYDYLDPKLQPRSKPGRDYKKIAEKMHLATLGDPDKIPYYMRYANQPLFTDEKRSLLQTTKLEDVKENEMVIKQEDKRDGRDYASNIEKMYNKVQKWKTRRAAEEQAMGIKPIQPPVANSKYKDKFQISASVILERYPTLTPPLKPYEEEHEQWEQAVRLQTCFPVIPWYIWKMEWEKLTEAQKQERFNSGKGMSTGGTNKQESKKKGKKEDKEAGPPTWGLPNVKLPELNQEEALEQAKADARRLKPYNDWVEFWKNWQAAPRETEDDLADNRKSINRALHKKLYLIIKKKNKDTWEFPSVLNTEEETIRKSAERSLVDNLGRDMTVYFHSNAPVGFYNNYYPTAQEQEKHQAELDKMFFMRARYFSGTPDPTRRKGNVDYLWVTREQLSEYLPKEYHDRVMNFIWPDPN